MPLSTDRRKFMAAATAMLFVPETLLALNPLDSTGANSPDTTLTDNRDLQKILHDLPHAREHIPRIKAACQKYANIYPIPPILAAKVQAIESGYDCDAISNSYAVGGAQFMHFTARDLKATLPQPDVFDDQQEVLNLRGRYSRRMNDAVAAFQRGDDAKAQALRAESEDLKKQHDLLHEKTMENFRRRMFAMTPEARRAYDARFDPSATDDMLVHYLAFLARGVKRDLDLVDEAHILLLAGVAYNAGPGNVKRKPGIPVVAQNVEYANKLMVFQKVKL